MKYVFYLTTTFFVYTSFFCYVANIGDLTGIYRGVVSCDCKFCSFDWDKYNKHNRVFSLTNLLMTGFEKNIHKGCVPASARLKVLKIL